MKARTQITETFNTTNGQATFINGKLYEWYCYHYHQKLSGVDADKLDDLIAKLIELQAVIREYKASKPVQALQEVLE